MQEVAMDSTGAGRVFLSRKGDCTDVPRLDGSTTDSMAVLLDRERKIMELLGTKSPDQILHDLRNILNEKELFRVLAFRDEK